MGGPERQSGGHAMPKKKNEVKWFIVKKYRSHSERKRTGTPL
jgi:hypothetical protein